MVNRLARPLLIFAQSYARACDSARELGLMSKSDFIYVEEPRRLRGLENMAYLIDDSFYQQGLSIAAEKELPMLLARLRPLSFEEYFSMRQDTERLRSAGSVLMGLDPAAPGAEATVMLSRAPGVGETLSIGAEAGTTVKIKLPESYVMEQRTKSKSKKPQK